MPDLASSLHGQDLERLASIAELWGFELSAPDARSGLLLLVESLLDPQLVAEVVAALPEPSRRALHELQGAGGRLPWPQFSRSHGEVREIGPARFSREQPYRNPASSAERLWYRGLLARAFFDSPSGPQEFAYIPDDLLVLLPPVPELGTPQSGRPARPAERAQQVLASDTILDHACTVLAGLRSGYSVDDLASMLPEIDPSAPQLVELLAAAGVLDSAGQPDAAATRSFLEAPRHQALFQLAQSWTQSTSFNDLRFLPHLEVEGAWQNDPLASRQAAITLLRDIPQGKWWHLPAFIEAVHRQRPDFQRTGGEYDSWYLKDAHTGAYLRGFEHWPAVEGQLLRWYVTAPLHWFGAVDLASQAGGASPVAFRLTPAFHCMLSGEPFPSSLPEQAKLHIDSKGYISLPHGFSRAARYQIARFCSWEPARKHAYRYRLSPPALERARDQDLTLKQILALLRRHAAAEIPPNIIAALERWDAQGAQARLEQALVLRLGDPVMLKALQASRAARFLGDAIGPAAVLVKPGARQQVLDALAEIGYLGQVDLSVGEDDV